MIQMQKGKTYKIKWQDHYSNDDSWNDDDDEINDIDIDQNDNCFVSTIGFFIKETGKYYVMAMNKGTDDSSTWMHILKNCVLDIKEVK